MGSYLPDPNLPGCDTASYHRRLSHSSVAVRESSLTGFIYLLTPQDSAAQVLLMN